MILSFKIAARFLTSSKGQTILIAVGIAIGVSVQIFIGLLIQGLQQSLIEKTVGNSSQITISSGNDNKLIENWEDKLKRVKNTDRRIENLSVSADSSAFASFDKKLAPVLVRGLNKEWSEGIYQLSNSIYEGSTVTKPGQILVGKELRDEFGLSIGDRIKISTASGKSESMEVVGFFDLKVASLNKSWIITDLKTSQELFDFGNAVTAIEMQLSDVFMADTIAQSVEAALNEPSLKVDNWKAQNESLLSGLNGQSISSIMIQVFVIISVVLGIASVLAISVMQKSRQIGILKAMGIRDSSSSLIFLFEGVILGVVGAVLGIILGIGLIYMFTKFAVNPDGTPIIEIYMNNGFVILSGLIAVLAAISASLIPAGKSSRLSPIEVIKNG